MSQPIKIVVVAETQQAATALQDFANKQGSGLSANLAKGAKEADNLAKNLGRSRMGLMELEHTARASTDILLMGGNTRMLLAQIPQLVQSLTMMGIGLSTLLPWLAAVGGALGAGYLGWKEYMAGVNDATDEVEKMTAALEKMPALLQKINGLTKVGLMSPAILKQLEDYQSGKTHYYRTPSGEITTSNKPVRVQEFYRTGDPFKDQQLHWVEKNPTELTTDEVMKYFQDKIPTLADSQSNALEKLKKLREADQIDELDGIDKIIAKTHQEFEQKREELRLTAAQAGKLLGPNQNAEVQAQIQQLDLAEKRAIAEAKQNAIAEQNRKDQQTLAEWTAEQKKIAADQDKQLEDAIAANRQQTSDTTIRLYQQEYDARIGLYRRELDQGIITEDELVSKTEKANQKRLSGEKAYQDAISRTNQLKHESAKNENDAKLHEIQTNPFLSDTEKSQQSIPFLRAAIADSQQTIAEKTALQSRTTDLNAQLTLQEQISQETSRQIELQRQLADAQGENSFAYQLRIAVTHLKDMNNLAKETAAAFENTFNSAISDVSRGITGLIMNTMTWRQFLAEIPRQILTEIVNAIVQMGIRWVATQIMMATVGKALQVAGLGASAKLASAYGALWATPATLATIASYGEAALSAPTFIGIAEGIVAGTTAIGFKGGGYTGDGDPNEIAGFVHRREFVLPEDMVRRVGVSNLQAAMHNGDSSAATVGASNRAALHGGSYVTGANPNIKATAHVIVVNDRSEMLDALKSSAAEEIVVGHVRKNRLMVGIPT